jgi:ribonucleotide monophosphatase NagD (HAD superfamily)
MVWCAGSLARNYAALGGHVQQAGKPFPQIYDWAAGRIGGIEGKRVLAIGDGLATDIMGANDYGLDALLVLQGIHANSIGDDPRSVAELLKMQSPRPRYVIARLS